LLSINRTGLFELLLCLPRHTTFLRLQVNSYPGQVVP